MDPESSIRERITRDRQDSHLEGHSRYFHEYEILKVVQIFSKEVLRPHRLLKDIDSDWDSIFLDVVLKNLNILSCSKLILGTWFPDDSILGVCSIGIQ